MTRTEQESKTILANYEEHEKQFKAKLIVKETEIERLLSIIENVKSQETTSVQFVIN